MNGHGTAQIDAKETARKLTTWAAPLPMDIMCPSLVLATSIKNWAKNPTEPRINVQVRKNYAAWLKAIGFTE